MSRALTQDNQLVVLTRYDSRFGEAFLAALAARGIAPALIVVSLHRWQSAGECAASWRAK